MEYLQTSITLLSLIAAILAWFVKLRWANEFKDAKEAQIQAIERELQTYKELNSAKIREYLLSTKETLEEYNNELQNALEIAQEEIGEKDERIKQLGDLQKREKKQHLNEKENLIERVKYLEEELSRIRPAYEQAAMISGSYNNLADSYPWLGTIIDFSPNKPFFTPLSNREMEVLNCIARGMSNKEIASLLEISHQTVKNHVTSILKKFDVEDRSQAIVYAIKRGWISASETRQSENP